MARIIVMPDATHLKEGIRGTILYAEQVAPEHLDDLISSEQILERLEGAVRGEAKLYEHAGNGAGSGAPILLSNRGPRGVSKGLD